MKYFITVALLFFTNSLLALPLKIEYTGVGSGSLNGTPFTNINFKITGISDTNNIRRPFSNIYKVDHISTVILLEGIGSYSFTTPISTFNVTNGQGVGVQRTIGPDLYTASVISSNALSNWNISSSLGPIDISSFELLQWDLSPSVITDGGILEFQNDQGIIGTFQSTVTSSDVQAVPSLSFLSLIFLASMLGLIGKNRRRFK